MLLITTARLNRGIVLSIYRVFQIFMQPMTKHQFNYWWLILCYFLT